MSSDGNPFLQFVNKHYKKIVFTTLAVSSVSLSAYYYYNYSKYNAQLLDSKSSVTSSSSKSASKKKKKSKASDKASSTEKAKDIIVYPTLENGEPDLSNKDTFTKEQIDTFSMALKDKGNSLFKANKFEDAIKYYNYALQLKQDPVFYSNLSASYVSLNQLDKVIECCNKALELKPDYSKVLLRRASANESLENYSDAMFDLSVLSLNGEYNGASIEPILERNLTKQAMAVLTAKNDENKEDNDKYNNTLPSDTSMASLFSVFDPETDFSKFSDEDEADSTLKSALDNLFKKDSNSFKLADNLFKRALELYKLKEEENSEITDNDLKFKISMSYEYAGVFEFLKNNQNIAKDLINHAIELYPRVNSYIYLALIEADTITASSDSTTSNAIDSSKCFEYFDKAIEINPESSIIYYHRAQVYFVTNEYSKASVDFEKSKSLNPDNIFPYIQLACLTYRENKFDDCETLFSEAKRKFPTSPEIPNFYAEVLMDKGDFDKASKNYDIAKRLEESIHDGIHIGISPLIGQATILAREPTIENLNKANALLEEACKIDPNSEQAKMGLAQLKLQKEEIDDAVDLFEEAASLSRTMEEKLQATTFAEAAKVQKRIRQDPVISKKIEEILAAAQGAF